MQNIVKETEVNTRCSQKPLKPHFNNPDAVNSHFTSSSQKIHLSPQLIIIIKLLEFVVLFC